jgi:hypothetical protein
MDGQNRTVVESSQCIAWLGNVFPSTATSGHGFQLPPELS